MEVIFFILFVIFGFGIFFLSATIWGLRARAKKRKERLDYVGNTPIDRFFIECVLSGVYRFEKEKDIERAKLLAAKYHLKFESITELYDDARKNHERISGIILNDKIMKQNSAETEIIRAQARYAQYTGREKRIAMLTDLKNELLKENEKLQAEVNKYENPPQKTEKNWAVWGGIADGLAGPGAGMAMAHQVQRENEVIRNENWAAKLRGMREAVPITNKISENAVSADAIQELINQTMDKLVSDEPTEEVVRRIRVSDISVEVSITGAFIVTATITAEENLVIYGDVPALVDGTLVANIYDGETDLGCIYMVFPVDGISDKAEITGIGLLGAEQGKKYTAHFTGYKLWLMEK